MLKEGNIVGELTFVRRSHIRDFKHCYSIFKCECGKEFSARNDSVRIRRIKSCGCKTKQLLSEAALVHQPLEYIVPGVKKMPNFRDEDIVRFWSKVHCDSNANNCWNWTTSNNGRYGYFSMSKSGEFKANRVAYFLHYEIDPSALHVLHSCDNGLCCNPHHLSLGNQQENMEAMVDRNRHNNQHTKNKN